MKQLTIRGFDDELIRRIRAVAREEGLSLNQAVLRLLRESGSNLNSFFTVAYNVLKDFRISVTPATR